MKPATINLVPRAHREAVALRRRRTVWAAALSCQLVWIVTAWVAARQMWPGVSSAVAAELSDTRQRISRLNAQLAQERRLNAEIAARQAVVSSITGKPDWSLLLKLIDQSISEDVVLNQSDLKPDGEHRLILTLRGIARSQASVLQLVDRLQQTGIFQDIRPGRIEREPFMTSSATSFELTCPIPMIGGTQP